MPDHFHIALSYTSHEAWLAKDLHGLLVGYGYKVYCYDKLPDEARGYLRENLREIYNHARLNILLWSRNYAEADPASFPSMERRILIHRHVDKADAASLLPISVDNHPLAEDIELATMHHLHTHGILGLEHIIIDRLRHLRARPTEHGKVFHPFETDPYRTEMEACEFTIQPNFQNDPRKRWQTLGDIWVEYPNKHGTEHVYLIPSGLCTAFLRHTSRMRVRPNWIEAKKRTGIDFANVFGKTTLRGFWFLNRIPSMPEREVVTVYSSAYDRYLNENFERHLDVLFAGEP